jgi:4-hydroxybenzoate polyprenyltransferase
LKALGFIINSNIFISVAAVSLALATQVQLGGKPHLHAYLAVIFFATLFDYNLHRYIAVYNKPEAFQIKKFKWATKHPKLLKILIISSFAGFGITLFFVRIEVLYLLVSLAFLSFLYSIPGLGRHKNRTGLTGITGMKTLLIAFVWTSATVLLPILQEGFSSDYTNAFLVFAERFAFIFAIAIPFDIRDMKADSLAMFKTIPIVLGENNALRIANIALLLSISIAIFHYLEMSMIFLIPAYVFSIVSTFIFINSKSLKSLAFYYHGILDGCIFINGTLIYISFYFQT